MTTTHSDASLAAQLLDGARNCMRFGNVKPGEEMLILSEPSAELSVIDALRAAGIEVGARVSVLVKEASSISEPVSPIVAAALAAADMVWDLGYPTAHTQAGFIAAFDHGTRNLIVRPEAQVLASEAALLPPEIFFLLGKRSQALVREFPRVHVTDRKGTDFRIEPLPSAVGPYSGLLPYEPGWAVPGYMGTFPPGTTIWGDFNFSARGTVALDAAYHFLSPSEPIVWVIEGGWVVDVQGGPEADEIKSAIAGHKNANRVAELGFGLNPKVTLDAGAGESRAARSSNVLSWSRRAGTFFFGMGGNALMGGQERSTVVPIYGVLFEPTVTVGDTVLIDGGRLADISDPDDELLALCDQLGGRHWLRESVTRR
jgi:2,5-dihydroxypyridine 5,6-dioxygenase